jgi:hypothetical protein
LGRPIGVCADGSAHRHAQEGRFSGRGGVFLAKTSQGSLIGFARLVEALKGGLHCDHFGLVGSGLLEFAFPNDEKAPSQDYHQGSQEEGELQVITK